VSHPFCKFRNLYLASPNPPRMITPFTRLTFFAAGALLFACGANAQVVLNGNFENTTATEDLINLTNGDYNTYMSDSYAFGDLSGGGGGGGGGDSSGDMDIINSNGYCGLAQSGSWYVALTGGGTDAISLTLSAPLIAGSTYTLRFYDRICSGYPTAAVEIGISDVQDAFGTLVYTAPMPLPDAGWTQRTCTFAAPITGAYITVRTNGEHSGSFWTQVDAFVLVGSITGESEVDATALRIYPVPALDVLRVEGLPSDTRLVELLDMQGRTVLVVENRATSIGLDVSDLAKGMYLLRMNGQGQAMRVQVK
jgi:Secretion system C-terminal sorting domain